MINMNTALPLRTRILDSTIRKVFRISALERLLLQAAKLPGGAVFLKFAPAFYSYPSKSRRICERNGVNYNLDISTHGGWRLYYLKSRSHRIGLFAKSEQTVVDIGANIGETALSFAKSVGSSGRVFAFEPNPEIFSELKVNCSLNSNLNVQCENVALGAAGAMVSMVQMEERNPGTMTIAHEVDGQRASVCNVTVSTLDDYLSAIGLKNIDLIKIDVEGYETFVLYGAVNIINECHPVLIVEICDAHQKVHGKSARSLFEQICSLGYRVHDVHSGVEILSGSNLDGSAVDVVCFHKSISSRNMKL